MKKAASKSNSIDIRGGHVLEEGSLVSHHKNGNHSTVMTDDLDTIPSTGGVIADASTANTAPLASFPKNKLPNQVKTNMQNTINKGRKDPSEHSSFFLANIDPKKQSVNVLPLAYNPRLAHMASVEPAPAKRDPYAIPKEKKTNNENYVGISTKSLVCSSSASNLDTHSWTSLQGSSISSSYRPQSSHTMSINKAPVSAWKTVEQLHRHEHALQTKEAKDQALPPRPQTATLPALIPPSKALKSKKSSDQCLLAGSESSIITTTTATNADDVNYSGFNSEIFAKLAALLSTNNAPVHDNGLPNNQTNITESSPSIPSEFSHTHHIPYPNPNIPVNKMSSVYESLFAKVWKGNSNAIKSEVQQYAESIYIKLQQHEEAKRKMQKLLDKLQRTHNIDLERTHLLMTS
jgi:hypothetical protein